MRRAASSPDARILIAALSGRSLAAAARRCGLRPLVLDLFADTDTRRLAAACRRVAGSVTRGFRDDELLAAADAVAPARGGRAVGLVTGAGFEDRPELLARLARGRCLLGNGPEVLARVKNPRAFFALADRLGVPHPEVRFSAPRDAGNWLRKRTGGSGGSHILPLGGRAEVQTNVYFQRCANGRAVSALFLADGMRALTLGVSEQWPAHDRPGYVFGGAAAPAAVGPAIVERIVRMVDSLVPETGLVGLNSADVLVHGDDFDLLEVNPRPGATLDLFDRAGPPGLFDLHCRACMGALPARWQPPAGAAACAIVYARTRLRVPTRFAWPRWTADRPAAGTRIGQGEPVCTVFAHAALSDRARSRVLRRAEEVRSSLETGQRTICPAAKTSATGMHPSRTGQ